MQVGYFSRLALTAKMQIRFMNLGVDLSLCNMYLSLTVTEKSKVILAAFSNGIQMQSEFCQNFCGNLLFKEETVFAILLFEHFLVDSSQHCLPMHACRAPIFALTIAIM